MNWIVYILECSDKTLYTGITKDIKRRMAEHENGTGAKYTKGRGPFKVVYSELQPTMSHALKREAEIKSLDRCAKQKLTSWSYGQKTHPALRHLKNSSFSIGMNFQKGQIRLGQSGFQISGYIYGGIWNPTHRNDDLNVDGGRDPR